MMNNLLDVVMKSKLSLKEAVLKTLGTSADYVEIAGKPCFLAPNNLGIHQKDNLLTITAVNDNNSINELESWLLNEGYLLTGKEGTFIELDKKSYHIENFGNEVNLTVKLNDQPILDKLIRKISPSESNYGSLEDLLHENNVPEEIIGRVSGYLEKVSRVETNDIVSSHQSFFYEDNDGNKRLLKVSNNKQRAEFEATANHLLGRELDFIVGSDVPEPLEANDLYVTFQEDVSSDLLVQRSVEYWIATIAEFHREGERILQENNVDIPDVSFRSSDEERERYLMGRVNNDLKFDGDKLSYCIEYLENTPYKCFIHNDLKNGNRLKDKLVDLELCGIAHPGIDLAMLLMQENVAKEQWDSYLQMYLVCKKGEYTDDEFKLLKEGTEVAAYYVANREVISSSGKVIREDVVEDNALLIKHARDIAKPKVHYISKPVSDSLSLAA